MLEMHDDGQQEQEYLLLLLPHLPIPAVTFHITQKVVLCFKISSIQQL